MLDIRITNAEREDADLPDYIPEDQRYDSIPKEKAWALWNLGETQGKIWANNFKVQRGGYTTKLKTCYQICDVLIAHKRFAQTDRTELPHDVSPKFFDVIIPRREVKPSKQQVTLDQTEQVELSQQSLQTVGETSKKVSNMLSVIEALPKKYDDLSQQIIELNLLRNKEPEKEGWWKRNRSAIVTISTVLACTACVGFYVKAGNEKIANIQIKNHREVQGYISNDKKILETKVKEAEKKAETQKVRSEIFEGQLADRNKENNDLTKKIATLKAREGEQQRNRDLGADDKSQQVTEE